MTGLIDITTAAALTNTGRTTIVGWVKRGLLEVAETGPRGRQLYDRDQVLLAKHKARHRRRGTQGTSATAARAARTAPTREKEQ